MKTEEIEIIIKAMREADRRIVLDLEREKNSKVVNLVSLQKIKTEKQFVKFFLNKPLVYKNSENHWWGFIFILDKNKNPVTAMIEIKRVYTPKGYVYFRPKNESIGLNYIGFTSHFFDRYRERIKIKNKDVSIRNFLKNMLTQELVGMQCRPIKNSKRREEVLLYIGDGVGLGEAIGEISIIMTFLSKDMLNKGQLRVVGDIEQLLETAEIH